MRLLIGACAALALAAPLLGPCTGDPGNRFPDFGTPVPASWTGPVFRLRQDYPRSAAPESRPWERIPFWKAGSWKTYLRSVLTYCFEGNVQKDGQVRAGDWRVENNRVRGWYHAPWLHTGTNQREFVHGLTRERVSEPYELAPTQADHFQNWAVAMYNPLGGAVLGRVWRRTNAPDPSRALFPPGTVAVKLLFTTATPKDVPYLAGSPEWEAYVYQEPLPKDSEARRSIQRLRLLQVDLAVRDRRADRHGGTGWVFGTFAYSSGSPALRKQPPWRRLLPVGLMWGNDSKTPSRQPLQETLINQDPALPHQHLGWRGRLAGPVDNPMSSCLSCHSTAQTPAAAAPLVPPAGTRPGSPRWMRWFRNLPAGGVFAPPAHSLDYSLQLSAGIESFRRAHGKALSENRVPVTRSGTDE